MCESMADPPPSKRLRISELNPHLLCALCGGYLIDATTIIECLHSFCKTCILRYLETSNYCPICEVLIHKTRPWQNIRLDHSLQNAVYKMVPGLFQSEMKRRREFYEKQSKQDKRGRTSSQPQGELGDRIIFSHDEEFSISIEFSPDGKPVKETKTKSLKRPKSICHTDKRYLKCPAGLRIEHLKKFIRSKFSLPQNIEIDLFYETEPLSDTYSLMDVAYIYLWKRDCVLRLFYSFYEIPPKVQKMEIVTSVPEKIFKKSKVKDKDEEKNEKGRNEKKTKAKREKSRDKKQGKISGKRKVAGEGEVAAGQEPSNQTEAPVEGGSENANLKRKHSDPAFLSISASPPKQERQVADHVHTPQSASGQEQILVHSPTKHSPASGSTCYSIVAQPSGKDSLKSFKSHPDSKASLKLLIKSSDIKDSKRHNGEVMIIEKKENKRQNGERSPMISNLFEKMGSLSKSSPKEQEDVPTMAESQPSQMQKVPTTSKKIKAKETKGDHKTEIPTGKPKVGADPPQSSIHVKTERKPYTNNVILSFTQSKDSASNTNGKQSLCESKQSVCQINQKSENLKNADVSCMPSQAEIKQLEAQPTKVEAPKCKREVSENMKMSRNVTSQGLQVNKKDTAPNHDTNPLPDTGKTGHKPTLSSTAIEDADVKPKDSKKTGADVKESGSDLKKMVLEVKPQISESKPGLSQISGLATSVKSNKTQSEGEKKETVTGKSEESAAVQKVLKVIDLCKPVSQTGIEGNREYSPSSKDRTINQPGVENIKIEAPEDSSPSTLAKQTLSVNTTELRVPVPKTSTSFVPNSTPKSNTVKTHVQDCPLPAGSKSDSVSKPLVTTAEATVDTPASSLPALPKLLKTTPATASTGSSDSVCISYSIASIVSVPSVMSSRTSFLGIPGKSLQSPASQVSHTTITLPVTSPTLPAKVSTPSPCTYTPVVTTATSIKAVSISSSLFQTSSLKEAPAPPLKKDSPQTTASVSLPSKSSCCTQPSSSIQSPFITSTPVPSSATHGTASLTSSMSGSVSASLKMSGPPSKTVSVDSTFLCLPVKNSPIKKSHDAVSTTVADETVAKLTILKEAVKLDNFLFDTSPTEKESPISAVNSQMKESCQSDNLTQKTHSKTKIHSPKELQSPGDGKSSKHGEVQITAMHHLPKTISQSSKPYSVARSVSVSSSSNTKPNNSIIQTTKISTLIPKSSSISSKSGTYSKAFSYPSNINNVPSSRSFLHSSLPLHMPRPNLTAINGTSNYQRAMLAKPSALSPSSASSLHVSAPSLSTHHKSASSAKHSPKETEGKGEKRSKNKTIPPLSIPKSCLIGSTPTLKLQRSPGSTDQYVFAPLSHYGSTAHPNGERSKSKESKHNGSRTPTSPPTPTKDSVFVGERQRVPTIKISDINRNPIIVESGSSSGSGASNNNNNNNNSTNNNNISNHQHHHNQHRSYSHSSPRSSTSENGTSSRTHSRGSSSGSETKSPTGSCSSTDRSPARESRRPSDSELLMSQHWRGYSAAADLLFNGFKLPPHPKFHDLHYDTDAMPLDYSQSSSKS